MQIMHIAILINSLIIIGFSKTGSGSENAENVPALRTLSKDRCV